MAKYLAVCEIETDDIEGFLKTMNQNVTKITEAGSVSDLAEFVSYSMDKQTYTETR
ncbi:MAG: hypothetical protein JSU58_09500 [Dehalococcoidales bacterium]|nr:MAG: hypothetical protein JSU58_09500 [Dehalococcoidales bacterium]